MIVMKSVMGGAVGHLYRCMVALGLLDRYEWSELYC